MTWLTRWLFHYAPPDDARRELHTMMINRSPAAYTAHIWRLRGQTTTKSSKGWPFVRGAERGANVATLPRVKRNG